MTDVDPGRGDLSRWRPTVRCCRRCWTKACWSTCAAIRAQLPAFDTEATWSIWLGPDAPPDAIAPADARPAWSCRPATTEAARLTELGRQGPALALRLLVVCAIAGSILAVGGTAIAIASTGRRRSFELASLRALGIRRRTLLRGSIIEQLLLLGAALVLGVPAGYLAARLAMPSIPEFADHTPVALQLPPGAARRAAVRAGLRGCC